MTAPGAVMQELIKAFEIANVELMVLSLPDAIITDVTAAAIRRWNCRREDVVNKQLAKFGTGTLSARYLQPDDDATPQKIEIVYAPPLGSVRASVFTPQSWRDGEREFMVLIGQHSEQAQAEAAIQNEQRLQLALRSGGYAIWDYDYRTGETTNSPEMYDLLGMVRDAPGLDFISFNDRVHPDDTGKTLDEKIRSAPFGADLFQTKYRVRAENGDYIWIESVAGIMRDPVSGKPAKVVGLCRNINDLMSVLEKIRLSERNLKRSQAAAKLGSFLLKTDTNTSKLSAEMIALLDLEDAIVPPTLAAFEAMADDQDRDRFREALEFARMGKKVSGLEISVKLKSGETQWFHCNMEPETGPDGRVTAVYGTCQSITERKTLEKKFLQAQKMEAVGQLTGGIAHDFNNLLMVVMGNLQLVEQLVKTDDRALKRIRAAMEATEKGSELTKRMLAFSRQQTLQNKELTVNDLLLKNQDMLRQAVGGLVDLKVIPGQDIWSIKADQTMLETAVLNLCINARDAMKPKGGSLIIETHNTTIDQAYAEQHEEVLPGDYVAIAVTDTGCGIPKENIEKVFQPFFTTKGPEAGSGLGLSMIYGFVKQSGGHIKIYSEVGHGTSVKMFLPRARAGAQPEASPAPPVRPASAAVPAPEPIGTLEAVAESAAISATTVEGLQQAVVAAAPPAPPPQKTLVLVVEDNPSVREVAAAMIEEMGYETVQASNGPEGLRIIEGRDDIALVLSDVIMAGGMNGPELAARALKVRPSLKILFMSGYAPGSVRQMQDLPDTIDLVNKPFTRSDLTEKVKRALAA
jgi:signal transduction histidine kinase/CheY-like chemotaxis protein